MKWHEQIGLLLLGAFGGRLALRLTTRVPAHIPGPWYEHISAKLVHVGMYPMMLLIPLSGVVMGYFGGKGTNFFGLQLPGKAEPKDEDWQIAKDALGYHTSLGSIFEVMIPLHIGATG